VPIRGNFLGKEKEQSKKRKRI